MKGANGAKHLGLERLNDGEEYELNEKPAGSIGRLNEAQLNTYIQASETVRELEELAETLQPAKKKSIADMTEEELMAELKRRKDAKKAAKE